MSQSSSKGSPKSASASLAGLEKIAGILTAAMFALLGAATIGGLVFPTKPGPPPPKAFHDLAAPTAPVRLVVKSLHISAPIVPIEVSADATLDPPSDYLEVGWWQRSAKPGASGGQTVVTGHTVHTGGGQMDHLGSIKQGAVVRIVTKHGTMWYRESRVVTYSKAALTKHAEYIFSQQRKHNRLVLITCSGWTGVDYTSNVVVFAQPLGVPNHKHPLQSASGTERSHS